jgi:NitT/TauT family transport system substrate-binding protein
MSPRFLAAPPICRAAAQVPVTVLPGEPRKLRLSWNANSICTVGVLVAQGRGMFAKRNLEVELINFGGSTDQLLEAIATGKSDAGVGMALRWLKPLEQGFDVKLTTAVHGGCMRLLTSKGSGITRLEDLKGKTIGANDMAAPDKNFFSIRLAELGIDPLSDVQWQVYPADLLSAALQKGEVQAFCALDPLGWVLRDRDGLNEIATNLTGEYAHRSCCVLGIRGSLVRDDRAAAAALTEAILEAQGIVTAAPDDAARFYQRYSPAAKPEQLAAMLRSHTHGHHPTGADFHAEIIAYVESLKQISVMKPSTKPERFANKVCADVVG